MCAADLDELVHGDKAEDRRVVLGRGSIPIYNVCHAIVLDHNISVCRYVRYSDCIMSGYYVIPCNMV